MDNDHTIRPITVGIMGGSASGKTTFATALADLLSDYSPITLHQDSYFRDWSEYPPEEREKVVTANHPDAVRWEVLIADVEKLRSRNPIEHLRREPVQHTVGTKRRLHNQAMS